MKTKLLLILSLFVFPSLSYGLSITIRIESDFVQKETTFTLKSSKKLPSGNYKGANVDFSLPLKTTGMNIIRSENVDFSKMLMLIHSHFPITTPDFSYSIKSIGIPELCAGLTELAVYNDFAITKEDLEDTDSGVVFKLYLYKQD